MRLTVRLTPIAVSLAFLASCESGSASIAAWTAVTSHVRRDRAPITEPNYRKLFAASQKSPNPKDPVNRLLSTAKLITYKSHWTGKRVYGIDMEPDRVAPAVECLDKKQRKIGFSAAYLLWKPYAEGGHDPMVFEFEAPRGTVFVRLQLVKLAHASGEKQVAAAKPRLWKLARARRQ